MSLNTRLYTVTTPAREDLFTLPYCEYLAYIQKFTHRKGFTVVDCMRQKNKYNFTIQIK